MASSSSVNVVGNTSNANIFIAWKEQDAWRTATHFYLQLQNKEWILAVVGDFFGHPTQKKYIIETCFYYKYREHLTGLGNTEWDEKSDVVAWLEAQIQPKYKSKIVMDAGDFEVVIKTADGQTRLAIPSDYMEKYSIPSGIPMMLKHGTRSFYVKVEDGHFTDGWNFFATEHGLQDKFKVWFRFSGYSTYETEILDPEGFKKVYEWTVYHQLI